MSIRALSPLKPDSSFEYRFSGHMIGDTSTGIYSVDADTVHFAYQLKDSSISGFLAPTRPPFAIWKKDKLYPMFYGEDKRRKFQLKLAR